MMTTVIYCRDSESQQLKYAGLFSAAPPKKKKRKDGKRWRARRKVSGQSPGESVSKQVSQSFSVLKGQ